MSTVRLPPAADVDAYLARARDLGARVIAVIPRQKTLEELFLHHAGASADRHTGASTDRHTGASAEGAAALAPAAAASSEEATP